MDRRTLLRTGGLAALGVGIGCAGKTATTEPTLPPGPRPANDLVPLNVSWDRVIHTTVGLRPFRESGFRVEPEKLDDKTIIHNYGHGGGGMSLSWGTGYLAAQMALAHGSRRAAVLGSGAVGLAAARQLQRRGFDVTIYTKALPPYTTSNMSLAGWTPTSRVVTTTRRTPQWDEQFRAAAEVAYRELQLMAGHGYGVRWMDAYSAREEIPPARIESPRQLLPSHLRTDRKPEVLGPGEHPFPTRYATRTRRLRIEPAVFLDAILRDFLRFGGRIVIREFETKRDLMSLTEQLLVNCTGLGSRDLMRDEEMTPIKGQLTLLVPQAEVDYSAGGGLRSTERGRGISVYMYPRRDGIALGGTAERGEWSLEPNQESMKLIVEGNMKFFNSMRRPWSTT
jgi:D-amino-acid oxidase